MRHVWRAVGISLRLFPRLYAARCWAVFTVSGLDTDDGKLLAALAIVCGVLLAGALATQRRWPYVDARRQLQREAVEDQAKDG